MRTIAAVAALLTLAGTAVLASPPPGRKLWQWTTEERIAKRFDPVDIEERFRAYEEKFPQVRGDRGSVGRPSGKITSYSIDGSRNPELFLPHELFESLARAFHPDPVMATRTRELYGPYIRAFGIDEREFWSKLEPIAANFVTLKYSEPDSTAGAPSHWRAQCRARNDGLQAARNTFAAFDVLLYTVVAPFDSVSVTTDMDPIARLRSEERCE